MRTGAALLAGALLLLVPAGVSSADPGPDSTSGCTQEPGSHTNMSARILNLSQGEGSARAIIEVRVWGEKAVSSGRVTAAATTSSGRAPGLDLPVRMVSFPGGSSVRLRYEVLRSTDDDVVLVFHLQDPDAADATALASTSLRLNLDPATRPERIDGRLQYRALAPAEVN